jgi:hypothetical protein
MLFVQVRQLLARDPSQVWQLGSQSEHCRWVASRIPRNWPLGQVHFPLMSLRSPEQTEQLESQSSQWKSVPSINPYWPLGQVHFPRRAVSLPVQVTH